MLLVNSYSIYSFSYGVLLWVFFYSCFPEQGSFFYALLNPYQIISSFSIKNWTTAIEILKDISSKRKEVPLIAIWIKITLVKNGLLVDTLQVNWRVFDQIIYIIVRSLHGLQDSVLFGGWKTRLLCHCSVSVCFTPHIFLLRVVVVFRRQVILLSSLCWLPFLHIQGQTEALSHLTLESISNEWWLLDLLDDICLLASVE